MIGDIVHFAGCARDAIALAIMVEVGGCLKGGV